MGDYSINGANFRARPQTAENGNGQAGKVNGRKLAGTTEPSKVDPNSGKPPALLESPLEDVKTTGYTYSTPSGAGKTIIVTEPGDGD